MNWIKNWVMGRWIQWEMDWSNDRLNWKYDVGMNNIMEHWVIGWWIEWKMPFSDNDLNEKYNGQLNVSMMDWMENGING